MGWWDTKGAFLLTEGDLKSKEHQEDGGFLGLDCRQLLPWDSSPYGASCIKGKNSRRFIFSSLCAAVSLLKRIQLV